MDILGKITRLRLDRGWTEYQLAERSELTQSTISSWYRKNLVPSVPSLERICSAFGISLAQFFSEEDSESPKITLEQSEILRRWNKLTKVQQQKLSEFIDTIGEH